MEFGRKKVDAPKFGADVEIREVTMEQLLPLFPLTETGQMHEFAFRLLGSAMFVNGKPIGYDNLMAMGASVFRDIERLLPIATEINGLAAVGKSKK
jgi:hypothetical protein